MEASSDPASPLDLSPTREINCCNEIGDDKVQENETISTKMRKPSGESSTTELSSRATSTPSSSPLVSAATSISSGQTAEDYKGTPNSQLSEDNCDLSSSENLSTKYNLTSECEIGSSGDAPIDKK